MEFTRVSMEGNVATLSFCRGKVNAFNEPLVEELRARFEELASDPAAKAIILTGTGKFFSFGFDIPEFMSYSPEQFTRYLTKFSDLYTYLFLFPKPVVAALNGHTIAGACMVATACDYRLMVTGKARISLNEITFGSSVFAGAVEMLKCCVGHRTAESILYTGAMYSAEEALHMGLIHRVSSEETLAADAGKVAEEMGWLDARAFASIKMLLRKRVANEMKARERDSIREFVDIWYSESTRRQTEQIRIRG